MSLIFDSFPTREKAQAFVDACKQQFGVGGQVFDNEDDAMEHDPIPADLNGFIVHIDRKDSTSIANMKKEKKIVELCKSMGGEWVGT